MAAGRRPPGHIVESGNSRAKLPARHRDVIRGDQLAGGETIGIDARETVLDACRRRRR